MLTTDLPTNQKLAVLIEAGRAMNPEMKHTRRMWGDGKTQGCAMSFALLAAGRETLCGLAEYLGTSPQEILRYSKAVIWMNDVADCSIPVIVDALVRNDLPHEAEAGVLVADPRAMTQSVFSPAQKPANYPSMMDVIFEDFLPMIVKPAKPTYSLMMMSIDEISTFPSPPKTVRVGKLGATWPVPKHCYA